MALTCPQVTTIEELPRILGYYYLGSPYSKYPHGIQAAFVDICDIAGEFARAGIPVYSPIAHTHSIARISNIDPHKHEIWLPFDWPMMRGADGMIVAMMESWEISYGLEQEIDYFNNAGRPIYYMEA